MDRAFSVLTLKSVDAEQRVITGVASTPRPDRDGDVINPKGLTFKNPLPLLLYHDSKRPVGQVRFHEATSEGIEFTAHIPHVSEPGIIKDRTDEAFHSAKYGLLRAASIGFLPDRAKVSLNKHGGFDIDAGEVVEMSMVAIPSNSDATFATVKSLFSPDTAALGTGQGREQVRTPGVTGAVVRLTNKGVTTTMTKSITDQIAGFEATRQAKDAERKGLMDAAAEKGETLDTEAAQKYDDLAVEIKSIDAHLARLREMEETNKTTAVEVKGATIQEAVRSRGGNVIQIKDNTPIGIGFARLMMCKMAAHLSNGTFSPLDIAKQRYPDYAPLHMHLKAAVPAMTTINSSVFVDPANLTSEFIEFLRPQTILGKFGQNGIPSLTSVPFNVRILGQTTGGNAWWVGQGKPKPVTGFAFNATTLTFAKIATIAVLSRELARFSTPSAEARVRDQLAKALRDQLDRDFIDPTTAAVTNVSPASITNGVTPMSSAGTSADNVRTDLANLIEQFILLNVNPSQLVLIMPNTLALVLSLMRNSLGGKEFPDLTMNGGTLEGIPVITSQYAANQSGAGNMVIAVNAEDIFLSDDGEVSVEASTEASLEMSDAPTNDSSVPTATSLVSMFQTNSIALLAERYINWAKARTGAVVYMDDVNWGSAGSPS